MGNTHKSLGLGQRGWMLLIYQFLAFLAFIVFTNYPMNMLADFYGGAQKVSTVYTVSILAGIVIQLALSRVVGKLKNIKLLSVTLGAIAMVFALGVMVIPPAMGSLWLACYALECLTVNLWCTFTIGILVGQWFPRRKGTFMGIATMAFPLGNGLMSVFASSVFSTMATTGRPNVIGAFLPFFIICVIGLVIGAIFVRDYPEQCGAFRDNDKSITAEVARAMMEQEIENKRKSVWHSGNIFKSRDFWCITVPMGLLLMCSVGMMTQTMSILGNFAAELAPFGGFSAVMIGVAVVACFGSWLLGVLDTKFGTKTAITISVLLMIVSGFVGAVHNVGCLLVALACLAVFMGASSNFTVSGAAQYWRREDFSNVFSVVNPVANIFQAIGPMLLSILIVNAGYEYSFMAVGILGVVSIVLILMFSPKHVKETDDKYRASAGLNLDDTLVGRK